METVRTDVLISGAGPTGVTLACALARAGAQFHLIDKRAERSPYSRALVVHLRSLEIFDQLGIADGLLAQGNKVTGARAYMGGKPKIEIELREQRAPGCRFRQALFIEQDRTEAALDSCLKGLGSEPLFSHELIDYTAREDGIGALCRNADGAEYRVECRYIVGCDGSHSVVRHGTGIPFDGAPYEQDFILADVSMDWQGDRSRLELFLDREGMMAIFPLRDKVRIIAGRGRAEEGAGAPSLEDFRRLMADLVPYETEISDPVWLARFRLHHRVARRFRLGRACLAGDAAHIHSPAGGQGMNTGIQDAWNLGWKLAWALGTGEAEAEELLESYHRERHPVGKELINTTDRGFSIASGRAWESRFMRSAILPWLAPTILRLMKLGLGRKLVFRMTQLGIHYRRGPLCGPDSARGRFTRALKPGDRMPDVIVGGAPLHPQLDPIRPTVLIAGTPDAAAPAGCKMLRLADPGAEDRALLGLKTHGLFLIRPDGHLAARSLTREGLETARLLRLVPGAVGEGAMRAAAAAGPNALTAET